jgi:hypothetical protein
MVFKIQFHHKAEIQVLGQSYHKGQSQFVKLKISSPNPNPSLPKRSKKPSQVCKFSKFITKA